MAGMEKRINSLFPDGFLGIIYDCDGVMIDSRKSNRIFYNLILAKAGLPPMTKEQEQFAFQSTSLDALLKMFPGKTAEEIDNLAKTAVNYNQDVLPHIRLMKDYSYFIEKAHKKGMRQAIDTNRTDYGIKRVLDFFDLPNYFNPVISCTGINPKPSPDGINEICKAWSALPEQVLFIGDSEDDRIAARMAEVKFASFGNDMLEADIKVHDFASLLNILWPDE